MEHAILLEPTKTAAIEAFEAEAPKQLCDLPYKEARAKIIADFEREYVLGILRRYNHNVSRAARAAGIDRVYLHRLIKKYDMSSRGSRG
jgi:DNA-binding NtrC family response regulator